MHSKWFLWAFTAKIMVVVLPNLLPSFPITSSTKSRHDRGQILVGFTYACAGFHLLLYLYWQYIQLLSFHNRSLVFSWYLSFSDL